MAKYLDPKADLTFKKVFGEHKELFTELSENYGCPQWMLNDENVVIFIDKYADILSAEGIYYSIEKYWNQISRERTAVNAAENKGLEEGLAKGREEGREEGRAKGLAEGREEGLAKGREEGRAKGRAKGREETKVEIARNLKSLGTPVNVIIQATGLTEEEINEL